MLRGTDVEATRVRELTPHELSEVAGGVSADNGEGFHEVPMDPNPMFSPEL